MSSDNQKGHVSWSPDYKAKKAIPDLGPLPLVRRCSDCGNKHASHNSGLCITCENTKHSAYVEMLEDRLRWRKWDEERPEPGDCIVMTTEKGAKVVLQSSGGRGITESLYWRPLDLPELES